MKYGIELKKIKDINIVGKTEDTSLSKNISNLGIIHKKIQTKYNTKL